MPERLLHLVQSPAAHQSLPVIDTLEKCWLQALADCGLGCVSVSCTWCPAALGVAASSYQLPHVCLCLQVHRGVYEAAEILYQRFLPLVVEHLASRPFAKIAFTVRGCAGFHLLYLLFPKSIMSAKRKQCLPVAMQPCSWQEACQASRSLHKDMATAFPAQGLFLLQGHSLGGSLGTLLQLMFLRRGEIPAVAVSPTYTFGAPAVFCEGGACKVAASAEVSCLPACHTLSGFLQYKQPVICFTLGLHFAPLHSLLGCAPMQLYW